LSDILARQVNVSKARALANMVFDTLACQRLPTFPRGAANGDGDEDDEDDDDEDAPAQCPYPLAREEVQRALQESLEHSMSETELNALSERIQPRRLPRPSTSVSTVSGRGSASPSQRNSFSGTAGLNGASAMQMLPLQRPSSSSASTSSVTRPSSSNTSFSRSSSLIRGSQNSAVGGTASTAVGTPFSVSPSSNSGQHGSPSAIRDAVSDAALGQADGGLFAQPEERPRGKTHVPLLLAGITVDADGVPAAGASSLLPCAEEETTSPSAPLSQLRSGLPDFQAMDASHAAQDTAAQPGEAHE